MAGLRREPAWVIKSRLLLYAASPLFNGGAISAAAAGQIPLAGYPVYNVAHWQAAADAAKAIMDLPSQALFIVCRSYPRQPERV